MVSASISPSSSRLSKSTKIQRIRKSKNSKNSHRLSKNIWLTFWSRGAFSQFFRAQGLLFFLSFFTKI